MHGFHYTHLPGETVCKLKNEDLAFAPVSLFNGEDTSKNDDIEQLMYLLVSIVSELPW